MTSDAPPHATTPGATDDAPAPVRPGAARRRRPVDGRRRAAARRGRHQSCRWSRSLAVLLVLLLLAAGAFLWFTRARRVLAVRTGDYAEALQAARSGVVDLTSFDYLTLDDDIEQIRRVATGDLREESVAELDEQRQRDHRPPGRREHRGRRRRRHPRRRRGRRRCCWSSSRRSESTARRAGPDRAIPHQVELEKVDGRWLLSGIAGTETE